MKFLAITLSILSLALITGCSGGGEAADTIADAINQGENNGDVDSNNPQDPSDGSQTSDPNNGNGGNSGGNGNNPNPTGPQPGDKVENLEGSQFASYPTVGTPVNYDRNINAEPNSDTMIPIVSIVNQPAPYIPQTQARIDIWAADNVNGTGLRNIQCSVDSASYSVCGEQLDLSNLDDGLHSVNVRAQDYDDNYSEEAIYYFYVDTTPPVVSIVNSPGAVSSPQNNSFQFSSDEAGSGLDKYECQINGGQYQDCNESLALQNLESGNQQINVRAIDNVGNISAETQYSWVVDGDAPIITVNSQPNDIVYIEFNTPSVNFSVVDTLSPQGVTITCTVNGQAQACASGQDVLVPTNAPTNYVFTVTAPDQVGNSATQSIQWQSLFAAEDRSTVASVSDDRPVDIMFVIDNSGSMNFERSSLAQRIDGMISKINGLDWQIGVISTDATSNDAKSMGRMIELIGMPGQYILDSTMDEATAQSVFGNTVQNFGEGSGRE
ncbi:MAG: hypothetical protein HRT44_09770 [Bdellovibrionales bacterium]|nr:hypothetical protein [Bdellovibrionales bacterium]NQZ19526.1 hypothetical protein [Bdellovibrionales bacterium]